MLGTRGLRKVSALLVSPWSRGGAALGPRVRRQAPALLVARAAWTQRLWRPGTVTTLWDACRAGRGSWRSVRGSGRACGGRVGWAQQREGGACRALAPHWTRR